MKLVSGSRNEDQVEDQDLGGRDKEKCGHCGRGPSIIANRLTSIEDELVAIRKLLETKPRRRSKFLLRLVNALDGSPLSHPDHVDDAHDVPSSPLSDQLQDLLGEVDDSAIDSEDRSPNGRITDVLAQIHGEDGIGEFGDATQNGYETANEEVI
ncbi:hypothetical protein K7X08_015811 [Anisodus acutangulus]|uniref:Uncharacterized protein n=1 Tax=Anisodus acutangulus TaxID=402998 RepID=A0A9Q1LE24_9SOLA|nr:hypothetical protein K7X08_015811 [Anisodus acutangulus]